VVGGGCIATPASQIPARRSGNVLPQSTSLPGATRYYTSLSQIIDDVNVARIYSGFHYRSTLVRSNALGIAARARAVANWVNDNMMTVLPETPVGPDNHDNDGAARCQIPSRKFGNWCAHPERRRALLGRKRVQVDLDDWLTPLRIDRARTVSPATARPATTLGITPRGYDLNSVREIADN